MHGIGIHNAPFHLERGEHGSSDTDLSVLLSHSRGWLTEDQPGLRLVGRQQMHLGLLGRFMAPGPTQGFAFQRHMDMLLVLALPQQAARLLLTALTSRQPRQ